MILALVLPVVVLVLAPLLLWLDRRDRCAGVIPNTFIACGEGGNYCSESCLRKR